MQISATGAWAAISRQDALTSNLANLNTVGFKPMLAGAMHRDPVRQEDGLHHWPSDALLERLGGGVLTAPAMIDFTQGAIEVTGSPLDLAIQGDGFFVVGNPDDPGLTRDGRLAMAQDGTLVMATTGLPLLDEAGQPIRIDPAGGSISVGSDGTIAQNGVVLARLWLADVPDRDVLKKVGQGLFADRNDAPLTLIAANGMVRQESVESSAVNEIDALLQIQNASRAAQSNFGMLDMQNRMLDRLVNTFGRMA